MKKLVKQANITQDIIKMFVIVTENRIIEAYFIRDDI